MSWKFHIEYWYYIHTVHNLHTLYIYIHIVFICHIYIYIHSTFSYSKRLAHCDQNLGGTTWNKRLGKGATRLQKLSGEDEKVHPEHSMEWVWAEYHRMWRENPWLPRAARFVIYIHIRHAACMSHVAILEAQAGTYTWNTWNFWRKRGFQKKNPKTGVFIFLKVCCKTDSCTPKTHDRITLCQSSPSTLPSF